jgi:ATP-binding cassette subfamily B (MDR/TAP) protein 1
MAAQLTRSTYYFIAAIGTAFVSAAQVYGCSMSGHNLSAKLRVVCLRAMLGHDVQWFDQAENTVGGLTSGLSSQPIMVQGLFGGTMGTLLYAAATVVGGSVIGLCHAPRECGARGSWSTCCPASTVIE